MSIELSEPEVFFAATAVQMDLVTPSDVVRAAAKKTRSSGRSLPELLEAEGLLTSEQRQRIEKLSRFALDDGRETLVVHPAQAEQEGARDAGSAASAGEPEAKDATPAIAGDERAPSVQVFDQHGARVTRAEADRYRVLDQHATGSQARILVAFDDHIGREVAIKEFAPSGRAGGTTPKGAVPAVMRFLREARVTGQLEHPNIVPVHEVGRTEDGSLYYTMRLVRGQTMEERLEQSRNLGDRLKLLGVFWDVCKAIAFAHSRGVVHRDIKPENVMVGAFGETVVLDWGVAKVCGQPDDESPGQGVPADPRIDLPPGSPGATLEGTTIGTPTYMSPEQAAGQIDQVDARSDVWGLGAMLYELLTGRPPFQGETPAATLALVREQPIRPVREVVPGAPAELAAVAEKALERDPARRYQSAGELAAEVDAYMTGGRVRVYEYGSWDLLRRFASRNKPAFVAATLAFAAVVTALVVVLVSLRRERAERRMANFNLAHAYAEKAGRLVEDRRMGAAGVFGAASLLYNPLHPFSRFHAADFDQRAPQSPALLARAASTLYRVSRATMLELAWVHPTGELPFEVVFSPDGGLLATACGDGTVLLLDTRTHRLVRRLTGHAARVRDVSFSPDGRRLATASYDRTLILWETDTGRRLRRLEGHSDRVTRVAFSPDGRLLASASFEGSVRLWDPESGRQVRLLAGHKGRVHDAVFSPDGTRLASCGGDRTVRIWDVESGEQLFTLQGHTDAVARIRYAPGGGKLASAGYDGSVRLWDASSGDPLRRFEGHTGHVYGLAFSPNGAWLASGGFDASIRLWDLASGEAELRLHAHLAQVSGIAFSPDGKLLASCGNDRKIKIWKLRPRSNPPVLSGHNERVYALDWSDDDALMASGSWDATIRLWEFPAGRCRAVLEGHTGYVNAVAIDGRAGRLASTSRDGTILVWDLASGRRLYRLRGHAGLVNPVVFSPDGSRLVAGHGDGGIGVWQAGADELERVLEGHQGPVFALAFSPDGRRLASGGRDHTVRIWDFASGRELRRLEGHTDMVSGLTWSSDGELIASSGADGVALLWDLEAGTVARRLEGHDLWVNAVRFSPDDRLLATASDDRTVRIWSAADGRPLLIIPTASEVMAIRFSSDGSILAVGDGQRVVCHRLDFSALHRAPAVLLERAERRLGRRLKGFELVDFDFASQNTAQDPGKVGNPSGIR